jgi:hypothetical protein
LERVIEEDGILGRSTKLYAIFICVRMHYLGQILFKVLAFMIILKNMAQKKIFKPPNIKEDRIEKLKYFG